MPRATVLQAEGSPQRQAPSGAAVPAARGEKEKEEEVSLMLGGDRGELASHQLLIISSKVLHRNPAQGDKSSPPVLTLRLRGK